MINEENCESPSRQRSKGEDLQRIIIGGEGRRESKSPQKPSKISVKEIDLDETQEEKPKENDNKGGRKRITFFKKKFKNDFAACKICLYKEKKKYSFC